mmetsp:Transcript_26961/g.90642  ORF Transcript_26961/g.90642 Transcript_26961/m.90642 type:complete len:201 (+) Transcript_26961:851-1453(+)
MYEPMTTRSKSSANDAIHAAILGASASTSAPAVATSPSDDGAKSAPSVVFANSTRSAHFCPPLQTAATVAPRERSGFVGPISAVPPRTTKSVLERVASSMKRLPPPSTTALQEKTALHSTDPFCASRASSATSTPTLFAPPWDASVAVLKAPTGARMASINGTSPMTNSLYKASKPACAAETATSGDSIIASASATTAPA